MVSAHEVIFLSIAIQVPDPCAYIDFNGILDFKKKSFSKKITVLVFFSIKKCELMFSEMFCLVLIRSFPGSFCCVAFVYKATNPHHMALFFSKLPKKGLEIRLGNNPKYVIK